MNSRKVAKSEQSPLYCVVDFSSSWLVDVGSVRPPSVITLAELTSTVLETSPTTPQDTPFTARILGTCLMVAFNAHTASLAFTLLSNVGATIPLLWGGTHGSSLRA